MDNSWKDLFGAMVLDQSVDNFVDELKRDREFSRNLEKKIDIVGFENCFVSTHDNDITII